MDSPTEVLGFVSFNGLNSVPPVLKHLNFEEIENIQNGIPLDWPEEVAAPIWDVSVKPMEKYLKDKNLLDSDNDKELFIICRSSVLHKMFFRPAYLTTEFNFKKTGNTISIEDVKNETDEREAQKERYEVRNIAKSQSIQNPDVEEMQVGSAKNVYVISRKRFFYDDGTIINLFVSKEVDGFYEKGQDKIPLILKLTTRVSFTCEEITARNFSHAIFTDYLSGGILFVLGVQPEKRYYPNELNVFEDLSSLLSSNKLDHLKLEMPKFLFSLTKLEDIEDKILKIATKVNTMHKEAAEIILYFNYAKKASSDHELVIFGTCKTPLVRQKFLNTDFIKMEHFKKGFYKEFMINPDKILFYGTVDEYAEVLRYMSSEQLAITRRVVGSSG